MFTKSYLGLGVVTASFYALLPIALGSFNYKLPMPYWTPFTLKSYSYWILYFQQTLVMTVTTDLTIAADCVISCFAMNIYMQLELSVYRFKKIIDTSEGEISSSVNDRKNQLKKCIKHHQIIYLYRFRCLRKFLSGISILNKCLQMCGANSQHIQLLVSGPVHM